MRGRRRDRGPPRSPMGKGGTGAANRIDRVLAEQPPGLWPFLPAGYPSLEVTTSLLRAFASLPIRGVELGFPFSDSIADGPVIQRAFSTALARGVRVNDVFELASTVRQDVDYPLLAMVSVSIVCRLGTGAFTRRAAEAGFDGLIVPDISLEEAPELAEQATSAGLRLSMLVAPTTPPARQRRIAGIASGFLYYVSVQGATGERRALPVELKDRVRDLRAAAGLPVLVGFGMSRPAHVRAVCRCADGAIVGSAIVAALNDPLGNQRHEDRVIQKLSWFLGSSAG